MIKKNTINNNNNHKYSYDRRHKWMQQKMFTDSNLCKPLFRHNYWSANKMSGKTKVEKYDKNSIYARAVLIVHARSSTLRNAIDASMNGIVTIFVCWKIDGNHINGMCA